MRKERRAVSLLDALGRRDAHSNNLTDCAPPKARIRVLPERRAARKRVQKDRAAAVLWGPGYPRGTTDLTLPRTPVNTPLMISLKVRVCFTA